MYGMSGMSMMMADIGVQQGDYIGHTEITLTPHDLHSGRVLWRPLRPRGEVRFVTY
jgi:hypothetical protein